MSALVTNAPLRSPHCPLCGGFYDLVHRPGCPRSMAATLERTLRQLAQGPRKEKWP